MSIKLFDLLDKFEVEKALTIGCPNGFQEVCEFFEEINQPFFVLPVSIASENDIDVMLILHPEHHLLKSILG